MKTIQINATFSPADQEAVMAAVVTIREKLPFLIDLTVDDRKALVKLGDKSHSFVRKAVDVAVQNPKMLPVAFDLEKMRKEAQLFDDLSTIQLAVDQLQKQIDDTAIQVGNSAYAAARTVYACAKSDFGRAALETAAVELGQRYARKGKTPPAATSDSKPAQPVQPSASQP